MDGPCYKGKTVIDWTEEKVRFILDAARDGVPRHKIAKAFTEKFGEPASKGAIIGKLTRDPRYVCLPTPIRKPIDKPEQPKPVTSVTLRCVGAHAAQTCVPVTLPIAQPEPVSSRRPGYRVDDTGCLWPFGVPGTPGFHYCYKPLQRLNEPYCVQHAMDSRHRIKPEAPSPAARARLPEVGD